MVRTWSEMPFPTQLFSFPLLSGQHVSGNARLAGAILLTDGRAGCFDAARVTVSSRLVRAAAVKRERGARSKLASKPRLPPQL
jgi:hypothetical protein